MTSKYNPKSLGQVIEDNEKPAHSSNSQADRNLDATQLEQQANRIKSQISKSEYKAMMKQAKAIRAGKHTTATSTYDSIMSGFGNASVGKFLE